MKSIILILICCTSFLACQKESSEVIPRPQVKLKIGEGDFQELSQSSLNFENVMGKSFSLEWPDGHESSEFSTAIMESNCEGKERKTSLNLGQKLHFVEMIDPSIWLYKKSGEELSCEFKLSVRYKNFSEDSQHFNVDLNLPSEKLMPSDPRMVFDADIEALYQNKFPDLASRHFLFCGKI